MKEAKIQKMWEQPQVTSAATRPRPTAPAKPTEAIPTEWSEEIFTVDSDAIVQLSPGDFASSHQFDDATTIWQDGSISDTESDGSLPLYIYSIPVDDQNSEIAMTTLTDPASSLGQEYDKEWLAPKPLGTIKITKITGRLGGVVSFTSSAGGGGTLDIAKGEWHFASK